MPKWKVKVVYLDNPAGPNRGTDIIESPTPPVFGTLGRGAFGRYRIKSKRPKRIDGHARRPKRRNSEADGEQHELF